MFGLESGEHNYELDWIIYKGWIQDKVILKKIQ